MEELAQAAWGGEAAWVWQKQRALGRCSEPPTAPARAPHHPAVVPRESSHFGFFNGSALLAMEETELYQQDWIGLRALDEGGERPGLRGHVTHACPACHGRFHGPVQCTRSKLMNMSPPCPPPGCRAPGARARPRPPHAVQHGVVCGASCAAVLGGACARQRCRGGSSAAQTAVAWCALQRMGANEMNEWSACEQADA